MTRCRCAECGNWLARGPVPKAAKEAGIIEVYPCGACLQEARANAIADLEPMVDESRD